MSQYSKEFKKAEQVIKETTKSCKDKDAKILELESQAKKMQKTLNMEIQQLEKLSVQAENRVVKLEGEIRTQKVVEDKPQ